MSADRPLMKSDLSDGRSSYPGEGEDLVQTESGDGLAARDENSNVEDEESSRAAGATFDCDAVTRSKTVTPTVAVMVGDVVRILSERPNIPSIEGCDKSLFWPVGGPREGLVLSMVTTDDADADESNGCFDECLVELPEVNDRDHDSIKNLVTERVNKNLLQFVFRLAVPPPVPPVERLHKYEFETRGYTTDTGSEVRYYDDIQAKNFLGSISGELSAFNEDSPLFLDIIHTPYSTLYLQPTDYEKLLKQALKTLQQKFLFHADAYTVLGFCYANGPAPKMRCETLSHIMFLRALQCVYYLHPNLTRVAREVTISLRWEDQEYSRPYIRAQRCMAQSFARVGKYDKAVDVGLRLLHVNPTNSAVKAEIIHWLLMDDQSSWRAGEFFELYCGSTDSNGTDNCDLNEVAWLAYGRVLIYYVKYQPEDQEVFSDDYHPDLEESVMLAVGMNAFVPQCLVLDAPSLIGPKLRVPQEKVKPGSWDEAAQYSLLGRDAWRMIHGSLDWLWNAVDSIQGYENDRTVLLEILDTGISAAAAFSDNETNELVPRGGETQQQEQTCAGTAWAVPPVLPVPEPVEDDGGATQPTPADTNDPSLQSHLVIGGWEQKEIKKGFIMSRDDPIFVDMLGIWGEEIGRKCLDLPASFLAAEAHGGAQAESDSPNQIINSSLRSVASVLPFPLRFQLERSVLGGDIIPLKLGKQPEFKSHEHEQRENKAKSLAREMLLVFITKVLPPLLDVTNDIDSITLSELIAEDIYQPFQDVKRAVLSGTEVLFSRDLVKSIVRKAQKCLEDAERSGVTESDLGVCENSIDLIKKRAIWPAAEYTGKFSPDGELLPTSLEVINRHAAKQGAPVTPTSRRALREVGWNIRDRIIRISSVSFREPYRSKLVEWLARKPMLCNRRYVYLFDRGTGKPRVWLLSPSGSGESHADASDFLSSLGCFEKVKCSKVGDRIGLAFTQTVPVADMSNKITLIPETVRNGFVFSEGCGVMGTEVAKMIQDSFHLPEPPGAVQIRIGGVKGMLSVKKGFPADTIGIRPSQIKFPSNHSILEVKRIARANVHDNRLFHQALLILDHLGIPVKVFCELQERDCAAFILEHDKQALSKIQRSDRALEECQYAREVLKHGRKENGNAFSAFEFEEIERNFIAAKEKMNLRCSLTLMQGIMDEHGILEGGEVLVGNGRIVGKVLICRSPCNAPEHIQMADAVKGRDTTPFKYFDQLLVFSSKGDHSLPATLGGDLDGDEYYIIDEPILVNNFTPAYPEEPSEPSEASVAPNRSCQNSQSSGSSRLNPTAPAFVPCAAATGHKEEHTKPCQTTDVCQYVCSSNKGTAPKVERQLEVLREYMLIGEIVASSAEAWVRIADMKGVTSQDALDMADLHKQALDMRKGSIQSLQQVKRMQSILATRKYGPRFRFSVLGLLYDYWRAWISDLSLTQRRIHSSFSSAALVLQETENHRRKEEARSKQRRLERDKAKRCYRKPVVTLDEAPDNFSDDELLQTDSSVFERLIDITFGKVIPTCDGISAIDWSCLRQEDLRFLARMVEVEFATSLRAESAGVSYLANPSNDRPHAYDVFLVKPILELKSMDLAVCLQDESQQGELVWLDRYRDCFPLEELVPIKRVASLSGTARILDNVMNRVLPGSLQDFAMKREMIADVVNVNDTEFLNLDPTTTTSMNTSQKQAVATVSSRQFVEGFLLVQGPPGTGKTSVLVGMISCLEREMIVSAPSNAAVANIALKLMSTGRFNIRDIVVYGENCSQSVQHLNPLHRHKYYLTFVKSYNALEDASDKAKKIRQFASWLNLDPSTTTMEEIHDISEEKPLAATLASARVVLCTLNKSGSPSLRKASQGKFSIFFLDEAGQCPEAEFYIATSFPGIRRVVCLGDPKQLPATVIDYACQEAGYGESWMSHVSETHPNKVHLLNTQYRMDTDILSFPNRQFYSNQVLSAECVHNREPKVETPFSFVDTMRCGEEEKERHSWKNSYEAVVIKSMLRSDSDIRRVKKHNPSGRTIIITPYQAQADLIHEELRKVKGLGPWKVATVDSFQGGEGDVVILSTVRTKSIGFIDDPQRLNVALTRAKRVLRVVGDVSFFMSLHAGSTLKRLAIHASNCDRVQDTRVKTTAWKAPDWTLNTRWKPTMTQRFHYCLRHLKNQMDKNVALNTLLAVALPDKNKLAFPPVEKDDPCWQMSALKKYEEQLRIVWIPRNGDPPIIEAHYCGSYRECLRFKQMNPLAPKNTACVKKDLSGIHSSGVATHAIQSRRTEVTWKLSNNLQDAVIHDKIDELPGFCFELDPEQEKILTRSPPLLLESRSGTGKTNVLFQHAIAHAKSNPLSEILGVKPICFVTVSPRLRRELNKRYRDTEAIEKVDLPPIHFFSLRELLSGLLDLWDVSKLNITETCTFLDYLHARKTHSSLAVEASLIENEIGGVIMGSLGAAIKSGPLTREEYIADKRSNVSNTTKQGRADRARIYDEYNRYRQWKRDNQKFDINDVVFELLKAKSEEQIFQSAYLDEIQDFSYAQIFLICSIAGKASLHWVCAGDTAQMISPGCSFKFDGLKQTMLSIRSDIEDRLGKVAQLAVNYRMTKDILDVGNAVLNVAKSNFPGQIEYARPETAAKDLGLKVMLIDWEGAMAQPARFGPHQAFVFTSTNDPDMVAKSANNWLKNHPFILTSLEAKGLEFDDVVVAFDVDRKAWDIASRNKQVASLRMLRELYVAITRAKRRVVILVQKCLPLMLDFFQSLGCNLEMSDAEVILLEFDSETTSEMWFKRGHELFEDENFKYAASCFKAAQEFGWSCWAQGLYEKGSGQRQSAVSSFRCAAHFFYEAVDYKHTLDQMREIIDIPPWDHADNEILDGAREKVPGYFTRQETVTLALRREMWDDITFEDLKDASTAGLFVGYREHNFLKTLIQSCSEEDRKIAGHYLPGAVGDYYLLSKEFSEAVRLYLCSSDHELAVQTTTEVTEAAKSNSSPVMMKQLRQITSVWEKDEFAKQKLQRASDTDLLLLLFRSPTEAAARYAAECINMFGHDIVKFAVMSHTQVDATELHRFSKTAFQKEVLSVLNKKFGEKLIDVVKWYCVHNDPHHANQFATQQIQSFSDDELLLDIIGDLKLRPSGLINELSRRDLLVKGTSVFLKSDPMDLENAKNASNLCLTSIKQSEDNMTALREVWRPRRNDSRVKRMMANDKNSKISLFLNLFQDPVFASKRISKQCMRSFGAKVVREAVKSGAPYKGEEERSILLRFDKKAFANVATARNEPAEKGAGARSPWQSSRKNAALQVGDRIVLRGLVKRTDLNGQHGEIVTGIDKDGRFGVKLPNRRGAKLSIKPENIDRERNDDGPRHNYSAVPGLPDTDSSSEGSNSSPPPLDETRQARSQQEKNDDDGSLPDLLERDNSSSSDESSTGSSVASSSLPFHNQGRRNQSINNRRSASNSDESDSDSMPPLQSRDSSSTEGEEDSIRMDSEASSISGDDDDSDSSIPPLISGNDSSSDDDSDL